MNATTNENFLVESILHIQCVILMHVYIDIVECTFNITFFIWFIKNKYDRNIINALHENTIIIIYIVDYTLNNLYIYIW